MTTLKIPKKIRDPKEIIKIKARVLDMVYELYIDKFAEAHGVDISTPQKRENLIVALALTEILK